MKIERYRFKRITGGGGVTTVYNGMAWLQRKDKNSNWVLYVGHETHPLTVELDVPEGTSSNNIEWLASGIRHGHLQWLEGEGL